MEAMGNMDDVMAMQPEEMEQYVAAKQAAAFEPGQILFNLSTTGNGKNGMSCNSCHPGGGTTGGEAPVPLRDFKLPIPTLIERVCVMPPAGIGRRMGQ